MTGTEVATQVVATTTGTRGDDTVQATPSEDVVLDVQGLCTHFLLEEGVVRAVDGADFTVRRGRTLCLVGESGSGKSITARSILTIVQPPGRIVSGRILLRDPDPDGGNGGGCPATFTDLASLPPKGPRMRSVRGNRIAMIFQEPMSSLSPVHTIGNQIVEAIRLHDKVTKAEARERAIDALHRVGIPTPQRRIDSYPFQLSGGMRQRAMIAMALSCSPELLIADEPTTALDVTTQAQILELLRELQSDLGMSMLFITHDLGVVAEMADDVAVMYLGGVVERSGVDELFHDPKHPYTRALLRSVPAVGTGARHRLDPIRGMVPGPFHRPAGCPFHPRCDHAVPVSCDTVVPPAVRLGEGSREVRCLLYGPQPLPPTARPATVAPVAPFGPGRPGPPLLEVRDLRMHFPLGTGVLGRRAGVVRAVDGVDLTLARGETLGLVGESGCGKSTLGRCVIRAYQPTSGEIRYHLGEDRVEDIARLRGRALQPYRRRIRMVFQDPFSSLNPRMTVRQIVGEPLLVNGVATGSDLADRVATVLRRVGMRPEYMNRYPHAFSGGQRQRIGIARAIVLDPEVVVADEAVSALDVSIRAQTLNLLQDLQGERGLSYLFVAHDLGVVEYLCDRVAVMYLGRIVELGATAPLYEQPLHPYTEALLSAVPAPDPRLRADRERIVLAGEVPDPADPPPGCPFHTRCRHAQARCATEEPPLRELMPGRWAACHFAEDLRDAGLLRGSGGAVGPADGRPAGTGEVMA
ncbi:MAG: dipeptide ABC transporter ATP-binding protein [Kineosporiaceae bacterium]